LSFEEDMPDDVIDMVDGEAKDRMLFGAIEDKIQDLMVGCWWQIEME
jgi:hypothetical protein